jgi:hypothetical protein
VFPPFDGGGVSGPVDAIDLAASVSVVPCVKLCPLPDERESIAVGVGSSDLDQSRRPNPVVPPLGPASEANGVGISITALGSIRSPDEPRWFGPPFSPSDARGVGSNAISVVSVLPRFAPD